MVDNSLTNRLLPLMIRKELFRKALQVGLFPLSYLQDYERNLYGSKYRIEK